VIQALRKADNTSEGQIACLNNILKMFMFAVGKVFGANNFRVLKNTGCFVAVFSTVLRRLNALPVARCIFRLTLPTFATSRTVFRGWCAATSFQVCLEFCKRMYIRTLYFEKRQFTHTHAGTEVNRRYFYSPCFHMPAFLHGKVFVCRYIFVAIYTPFLEAKFCGVPSCICDNLGCAADEPRCSRSGTEFRYCVVPNRTEHSSWYGPC
jgi:hypothetical protein